MRLLVAESDPTLAFFLTQNFDQEHYAVDLTANSADAKQWVETRDYDLAILDLNVGQDGTQLVQHVRAKSHQLPILVLSGQSIAKECVQLLDMGADDLVVKPFLFLELSARVRALLRRTGRSVEAVLRIDDLELNRPERSVRRGGRAIELTPKEFGMLEYFMRNVGRRVTRADILKQVWKAHIDPHTNVVDVYVNYLRKKIERAFERKLIHTVRGIGYEMRVNEGSQVARL
jgi:two-component system copper resistance phosphate regulon response regulator CusR